MARIRTVKPDFYRDEDLQDLERANPGKCAMLVFSGLWGHCDKNGNFEWKPRVLKLDILPFLDFDMADTLGCLASSGFIHRYVTDGKEYGHIPTFGKHQRIGGKEAQESGKFPNCPPTSQGSTGEAPGKHSELQEGKGREVKKPPAGGTDSHDSTIWSVGLRLLTKAGTPEATARTFLGKHYKSHKEKLAEVIARLSLHPSPDPKAYIEKALTASGDGIGTRSAAELES